MLQVEKCALLYAPEIFWSLAEKERKKAMVIKRVVILIPYWYYRKHLVSVTDTSQ